MKQTLTSSDRRNRLRRDEYRQADQLSDELHPPARRLRKLLRGGCLHQLKLMVPTKTPVLS